MSTSIRFNIDPIQVVTEQIQAYMQQCRAPGVCVALQDPAYFGVSGQVFSHGVAWLGQGAPAVNAETVFEIGSVTKVFTSLLLAMAQVETGIDVNAPACPFLKGYGVEGDHGFKDVTLLQLATHTSCIPDPPASIGHPSDALFSDRPPDARLVDFLNTCIVTNPGSCWHYSDIGFVTLGHTVTQMFGNAWLNLYNVLLAERITSPLGMTSTAATVTAPANLVAKGYLGTKLVPARGTASDLKSTGADMLTFLKANLGQLPPAAADPLRQAIDLTQKLEGIYTVCGTPLESVPMGLGWQIPMVQWAGLPMHYKNGATSLGGQSCAIEFCTHPVLGIAVLTNQFIADPEQAEVPGPTKLANSILRALHPELQPRSEPPGGRSS